MVLERSWEHFFEHLSESCHSSLRFTMSTDMVCQVPQCSKWNSEQNGQLLASTYCGHLPNVPKWAACGIFRVPNAYWSSQTRVDSDEAGSRKAGILPSNYSHCSYVPTGIIHDETDSSADVSRGYYMPRAHVFGYASAQKLPRMCFGQVLQLMICSKPFSLPSPSARRSSFLHSLARLQDLVLPCLPCLEHLMPGLIAMCSAHPVPQQCSAVAISGTGNELHFCKEKK